MGLSLEGLWMRLLSNEVNPHDINERHTRFLRMPCQQKHCPGDRGTGQKGLFQNHKPGRICSAIFRNHLRSMPLFFFPFQFSSCLHWNTYNCYSMLVPPLYFVPFLHRPTDGKTLYPQNGSFPELHPYLHRWRFLDFWADAILDSELVL